MPDVTHVKTIRESQVEDIDSLLAIMPDDMAAVRDRVRVLLDAAWSQGYSEAVLRAIRSM